MEEQGERNKETERETRVNKSKKYQRRVILTTMYSPASAILISLAHLNCSAELKRLQVFYRYQNNYDKECLYNYVYMYVCVQ